MSRISGDIHFSDRASFANLVPSPGAVRNAHVASDAGIETIKMVHKHRKSLAQNGTAVADVRGIHVVIGTTGLLVEFKCGLIGPCTGDATVTVDLKKNGASILSAAVVIDSGDAARALLSGAFSSAALVVGDVLEVVVTVNAGTGALGTGLFAELEVDEDAV